MVRGKGDKGEKKRYRFIVLLTLREITGIGSTGSDTGGGGGEASQFSRMKDGVTHRRTKMDHEGSW